MSMWDWPAFQWVRKLGSNVVEGYKLYDNARRDMIPGLFWDVFYSHKLSPEHQRILYGESEKSGIERFMLRFSRNAEQELNLVAKPLSSLQEVPVLKDILWAYDRGITYGIRRPITTAMLAGDYADTQQNSLSAFFSGETWRNAWNESERVTPGQAVAFNALQLFGVVPEEERAKYDPRTPEGREHYYDDALFRYASGSFDVALTFVDPFKGLGKLGKLGLATAAASNVPLLAPAARKTAEVTGVAPTKKMLAAGYLEKEAFGGQALLGEGLADAGGYLSPSYERLYRSALENDAATYQRLHFNDMTFGGSIAQVSWAMAQAGDRGLFADSLMAARGSREAMGRLQQAAPMVANNIGRTRQALNLANAMNKYADDASARDAVDANTDAQFNEWVDSFGRELQEIGTVAENAESFWYGYANSAEGRGKIRANIMQKLRVGLHEYAMSAPVSVQPLGATMGRIARGALKFVDPSARYDSLINVNSVASYRNFRYNLDRSWLPESERNELVSRYMLAATAEARSQIIVEADKRALGQLLSQHGLTTRDLARISDEMEKRRTVALDMLRRAPRHIPNEFLIAANRAAREGRAADRARMEAYYQEFQRLADEGEAPSVMNALPVGDRGYLGLGTGERYKATTPLMRSTTANLQPMMDYRALEVALRREFAPYLRTQQRLEGMAVEGSSHLKDLVSQRTYQAEQFVTGALKAVQTVWAITALLRPAQFIRSMADDGMRAMVWHGMTPYFLGGLRGAARLGMRAVKQGLPFAMQWAKSRATFLASGRKADIEMRDVDLSGVHLDEPSGLADERAGFYQLVPSTAGRARIHRNNQGNVTSADFDTLEEAIARGVIPPRAYVAYVQTAYREGRAPWPLVSLVEMYESRYLSREQFEQHVLEYAMDQAGVSAYSNPQWQRDFFDVLRTNPGGVMADPRGIGLSNVSPRQLYESYDSGPVLKIPVDATDGSFRFDDLNDFLNAHLADIVERRYQVHAARSGAGHIIVTLARRRDAPRTVAERMTRQQRVRLEAGLKAVGQEDIRMVVGEAQFRARKAFAGMEGDWLRTSGSSGTDLTSAYASWLAMKQTSRQVIIGAQNKTVRPHNDNYPSAWEYTANILVGNDPVMRLALEGKSYADVLAWTMTPEGSTWVKTRQQRTVAVEDQVRDLMNMALRVVPDFGDLRQRALAHDAKFSELETAYPNVGDRPQVLGPEDMLAMGQSSIQMWARKYLDKWFRWMSDMPIDRMIRHPFMAEEYNRTVQPLLTNYRSYVDRTGGGWTESEIRRLESVARQQTLDVTMNTLYDSMARTDAAQAVQLMMPFANAIADSYFKWFRLAWTKPMSVARMWHQYWMAPERMGLVYDQDGYYLERDEEGRDRWVSPLTGEQAPATEPDGTPRKHEKYVLFRLPEMGGRQALAPGSKFLPAFNKDSMNPILSLPTAGPIVAIPANQFLLDKPEWSDKWYIKTFVLPFGVTDDSVLQQASPGLVRAFVRWRTENQDLASSTAMQIYQMQWVEYQQGERAMPPKLEEVKAQAASELGLRFLVSGFSPVSLQYYNPYKPYTDYYRMLLEKHEGNDDEAMVEFRENAGDDFLYMTAHVSRANVSMPATMGSYKSFKANEERVRKHPELAGLILGQDGAGSFNKAVYEWQKTLRIKGKPVREVMTITESTEELEKRTTWADFTKFMDLIDGELEQRGLTSLRSRAALDLAAAKQQWVEDHMLNADGSDVSAWYKDYMATDGAAITSRITKMQDLLRDREFLERREDLQQLQVYLYEREAMRATMENYGFGSLDSQQATWLAEEWDATVARLKGNLAFAELYNRWLSRDNLSKPDPTKG